MLSTSLLGTFIRATAKGATTVGAHHAEECKHSAASCGGSGLQLLLDCGLGEDGNAERSRCAGIQRCMLYHMLRPPIRRGGQRHGEGVTLIDYRRRLLST